MYDDKVSSVSVALRDLEENCLRQSAEITTSSHLEKCEKQDTWLLKNNTFSNVPVSKYKDVR